MGFEYLGKHENCTFDTVNFDNASRGNAGASIYDAKYLRC
jgi:hypothetical protein